MPITVELPAELQERFTTEAVRAGVSPEAMAVELLGRGLTGSCRAAAVALLDSWMMTCDGGEQRETGNVLVAGLTESRAWQRPLFPVDAAWRMR